MGVYMYASWCGQGSDYHDARFVEAALGVVAETVDVVAYKLLKSLYDDPSCGMSNQELGLTRYNNLTSHPFHQVFGAEVKSLNYDLGLNDYAGETDDPNHIKAFVACVGWREEAIPLIQSLHWG